MQFPNQEMNFRPLQVEALAPPLPGLTSHNQLRGAKVAA